jgi:hypothetical protein
MAVVPSVEAQNAVFASNQLRALIPSPPARRWRPWRSQAPDPTLLEFAIPRAVAIAEDYLLIRATRRLKPSLLAPVPPGAADATTKKLQSAARDLSKLVKLWQDDLGVDPTTVTRWRDFKVTRELRHVLVHRLAMWQPGLDPKPNLHARIAALGVHPDLYRGRVPVVDADLTDAVSIAKQLVDELDPQT